MQYKALQSVHLFLFFFSCSELEVLVVRMHCTRSSLVLDSKTYGVKGNCSMTVQLEGIRYIILYCGTEGVLIRRSILIGSLIYT